ncbi:alpha/beta hydrolase [Mesobacillus foraminis]|uniref:Acetyl esterase/lipase n=1 Tax=Mesobacillus foraminis TaxID=279826 RepID=A0A4R2BHC3_9BACI|nr:alpha/beta hydrolase [Mesobacillus foraminis]TCN26498.1 acetyl esterase/lipase [Mesobacillus foraminis]
MEIYQTEELVDIVYGQTAERELKLDIIQPVASEEFFPAIIYVHGGGWMSGDKSKVGGEWNASFAKYGFVCININFRLSGEAIFPAPLLDVKQAIRWVKLNAKNYNIDENKVGIWGHSSGGHLATLAALSADHPEFSSKGQFISTKVNAVATLAGPVDLLEMGGWHNNPNSPESKFLGGSVQEQSVKAELANPIHYINEDSPPVLIIQGDYDEICPVQQSQLLHTALPNSSYLEIKGADHDFVGGVLTLDDVLTIVRLFFNRNLKTGLINKEELAKHREEVNKVMDWFKENSR